MSNETRVPRPARPAPAAERSAPTNALAAASAVAEAEQPTAAAGATNDAELRNQPRGNAAALGADGATDDDTGRFEVDPSEIATEPETADEGEVSGRDGQAPNFKRVPFGAQLPKLGGSQRPGYRRYWFNDKPGRLARAKQAGYAHVMEDGQPMSRVVSGGGVKAYLMEIPHEWFRKDMKAQQAQVDEIDRAIRGGQMKANEDDDSRYVPKRGIRFEEGPGG